MNNPPTSESQALDSRRANKPGGNLADYVFRGTTQSLCPECLAVVPAKIIVRGKRVYFRKHCSKCGQREDFICSNVDYYDRLDFSVPSKIPAQYGVQPNKGCPYDCGLCTEHEQHTCIALVEVSSSCNLSCPMCFASSGPGGKHLTLAQCQSAIDRIVEVEGRAEVIQLSGGEPTLHPQFAEILHYALSRPVDYVQINTNGLRLAHDSALIDLLSEQRKRVEVFLQLDGLDPAVTTQLRGEDVLPAKLQAIERLGQADVHITLAVTLQGGVNDDEIGPLIDFAVQRPWITGINFQPATYSGRHELPETLENRITFPDVMSAACDQSRAGLAMEDFIPLPCAHPNCHIICLSYRRDGALIPVNRFIDTCGNLDLLANGISFTREKSLELLSELMDRVGCCSDGSCGPSLVSPTNLDQGQPAETPGASDIAGEFLSLAVAGDIGAKDLFRITITSFLDAYNFDLRRLMKCCTHHVLPSGHVIPFCAYNVLYREGHAALPPLMRAIESNGTPSRNGQPEIDHAQGKGPRE